MHGHKSQLRRKISDYGEQLREKQKAKRIYGILERQFRRYFREAERRKGMTGSNLLIILETRLDNVVYRLGLADSRAQARQLVAHGHIDLNGCKTDIPSALVRPGDVISIHPTSRDKPYFKERVALLENRVPPSWMTFDPVDLTGRILELPSRQEIDVPLREQLIVEYYSR